MEISVQSKYDMQRVRGEITIETLRRPSNAQYRELIEGYRSFQDKLADRFERAVVKVTLTNVPPNYRSHVECLVLPLKPYDTADIDSYISNAVAVIEHDLREIFENITATS